MPISKEMSLTLVSERPLIYSHQIGAIHWHKVWRGDTAEVIRKHTTRVTLKRSQQNALLGANQMMATNLQAELVINPNMAGSLELVKPQNTIAQLQYELAEDIPYKLDENEKVKHDSKVKSHNKVMENIKENRGKVFMMILGQCTSGCKTS